MTPPPLTERRKELLKKIIRIYTADPLSPVIVKDLVDYWDKYSTIQHNLYKLEADGWIELQRKNGDIRAIIPLWAP